MDYAAQLEQHRREHLQLLARRSAPGVDSYPPGQLERMEAEARLLAARSSSASPSVSPNARRESVRAPLLLRLAHLA